MERSGPTANHSHPAWCGSEVTICCALTLCALYAQPGTEPPSIGVNVRLVNVFVNVTDDTDLSSADTDRRPILSNNTSRWP
jgi:hypothetical protein